MKRKRIIAISLISAFVIICLLSAISLYRSNRTFTVTYYAPFEESSIRAVILSDLHACIPGGDLVDFISAIKAAQPDLILITGDIVTHGTQQTEIEEYFALILPALTKIAPVFASYGNHETDLINQAQPFDFAALYGQYGVCVLDNAYADLNICGRDIRLGGLTGPAARNSAFISDFCDTDNTTVLMSHFPASWYKDNLLDAYDVDCVLCGHAHGGLIRLPLLGGMYDPECGFGFSRLCGVYSGESGSRMILSRGLGNQLKIPRFCNIPEIVCVDF